jgi:resuscitation-promoting factor RpfB
MEEIPNSHTVVLLEQERQQMIAMSEASRTLTVVARPKLASPQSAASSSAGGSSSSTSPSGGTSGSGTGTTVPVVVAAPAPGTAKSIAYNMMASFGFPTSEFSCLDDLWTRESGWIYDAENPASGAYGIPQAFPGYKMAQAGADWQTNPATQIRWGLGYIQSTYGNPCTAWNYDLANDGY